MAHGIDVLKLYQAFGLEPGAGIDDLRLAYRRRVAKLHPDRHAHRDPISAQLAGEELKRLTVLYDAGVDFHRRHGRLPGAAPAAAEPSATRAGSASAHAPVVEVHRRTGLRTPLIVFACAAAFGAWYALQGTDPADDAGMSAPVAGVASRVPTAAPVVASDSPGLYVGMRAEDVVRQEGEPIERGGVRWDYGPSWVMFHQGRVTEWYSSPLRPLRIARVAPAVDPAPAPRP
ncbi:J domain-containing protein [Dokdonella sp. MW10]|uniref:J domain-containing protein n=1 Tax=Dokdonella sp. MW10 TaxID=2992926 RepID=UPI003F7DB9A3